MRVLNPRPVDKTSAHISVTPVLPSRPRPPVVNEPRALSGGAGAWLLMFQVGQHLLLSSKKAARQVPEEPFCEGMREEKIGVRSGSESITKTTVFQEVFLWEHCRLHHACL